MIGPHCFEKAPILRFARIGLIVALGAPRPLVWTWIEDQGKVFRQYSKLCFLVEVLHSRAYKI